MRSLRRALLAGLLSGPASAELAFFPDRKEGFAPDGVLTLSARQWMTEGRSMFRKSFPFPFTTTPPIPPDEISMGSTLQYRELDTPITLVTGEFRPVGWLSFELGYGASDFGGGKGTDHDWIHSPDHNLVSPSGYYYQQPGHYDFSESRFSVSGRTRLMTADANVGLFGAREEIARGWEYSHFLELSAGYQWYEDDVRMREGFQVEAPDPFMNFVVGLPPAGSAFPGLDSTFRFRWNGPRVGLRETCRVNERFWTQARLGYSPWTKYEGRGIWNLRSDWKKDPSFAHSAAGRSVDYAVDVRYALGVGLSLRAGYLAQFFSATDGDETIYFSDGTVAETTLEKAKSVRTGMYAGADFRF